MPYETDTGAGVPEALSRQELEALHCWEADDRVPGRPAMTAFRRRLRCHQAQWREVHGHPIGSQPIAPSSEGEQGRLVGSRLPLAYARATGATFLTAGALDAARARTSVLEPRQSVDHQRLWADLLWSPTLALNLFGDLAADLGLANRAVHTWWPDAPGTVCAVRFVHSPGWLNPAYLNNLCAFDAAFVLGRDSDGTGTQGTQGIVGVDINYHERAKPEIPKPSNRWRYVEVAERSGVFVLGALDQLTRRSELAMMWLEHLLLLSMLRQDSSASGASGRWSWGRYVVVYPAGNTDVAAACARYRALLVDASSFSSVTIEELLDTGALPPPTVAALRDRYLPG